MDLSMCGNKIDSLDRYRGHVAINVKYHGTPKISKETLARLARLDGATRDNVLRYAEEGLRENWWVSMQERSRELGLGELWSEGRSGGWLVFKTTISRLQELIDEVERSCKNCELPFDQHVEGKCPFQASSFVPADDHHMQTWEAYRVFADEVKDSLLTAGDTFEDEILFQLENLDDDGTPGDAASGGSEADPEAFKDGAEED